MKFTVYVLTCATVLTNSNKYLGGGTVGVFDTLDAAKAYAARIWEFDASNWVQSMFDLRNEWGAKETNGNSTNYYTITEVIR